jgi:dihydroorotate dehydrogenase
MPVAGTGLARLLKLVVGVGGISSLADAKAMRKNGADLVEVFTSFIYQGPALIRALSELQ